MSVSEGMNAGMRATNALFSTLVKQQTFDLLDDVYTKDARILPPGAPMMEGRAAIKTFWQQAVTGMGITAAELSSVDVQPSGDNAVEIGSATLTLNGGQQVVAKYVVHWKQEEGKWKWQTDIWNLNA